MNAPIYTVVRSRTAEAGQSQSEILSVHLALADANSAAERAFEEYFSRLRASSQTVEQDGRIGFSLTREDLEIVVETHEVPVRRQRIVTAPAKTQLLPAPAEEPVRQKEQLEPVSVQVALTNPTQSQPQPKPQSPPSHKITIRAPDTRTFRVPEQKTLPAVRSPTSVWRAEISTASTTVATVQDNRTVSPMSPPAVPVPRVALDETPPTPDLSRAVTPRTIPETAVVIHKPSTPMRSPDKPRSASQIPDSGFASISSSQVPSTNPSPEKPVRQATQRYALRSRTSTPAPAGDILASKESREKINRLLEKGINKRGRSPDIQAEDEDEDDNTARSSQGSKLPAAKRRKVGVAKHDVGGDGKPIYTPRCEEDIRIIARIQQNHFSSIPGGKLRVFHLIMDKLIVDNQTRQKRNVTISPRLPKESYFTSLNAAYYAALWAVIEIQAQQALNPDTELVVGMPREYGYLNALLKLRPATQGKSNIFRIVLTSQSVDSSGFLITADGQETGQNVKEVVFRDKDVRMIDDERIDACLEGLKTCSEEWLHRKLMKIFSEMDEAPVDAR